MRTLATLALSFSLAAPTLAADKQLAQAAAPAARTLEVKVTDAGFEPRELKMKKGEATTLIFTRVTDRTCITAIDIPDEGVKSFKLPLNRPVSLTLTPKKVGVEAFHCSAMGMGNGKLIVSE
jgi:plastocyanin domain-containing protein